MDALKKLSNYKDISNVPYILFGVLVIDLFVIALAKGGLLGSTIIRWYNDFGLSAVLADTLVIVLVIIAAQYVYTEYFSTSTPLVFVALTAVFQQIHDVLFYLFAILGTPKGQNKVMDLFKAYAKENGSKILVADLLMVLGTVGVAAATQSLSQPLFVFLSILAVYTVPYIIA